MSRVVPVCNQECSAWCMLNWEWTSMNAGPFLAEAPFQEIPTDNLQINFKSKTKSQLLDQQRGSSMMKDRWTFLLVADPQCFSHPGGISNGRQDVSATLNPASSDTRRP